ncbi:hypothetical protein NPIL_52591 [Nephila pilipes]|uniref:Uncharacterized protein n=1 Tax=Nephila pilipes TaxID=299642 RepID=A0A8X6PXQ6_NEPPI|nr:hypothetical protein NPIL_52591 [Nephila pilipes]
MRLGLVKRIYRSDWCLLLKVFKISSLDVNTPLPRNTHAAKLEISHRNLFQILCDSTLNDRNSFETVTFQPSLELWEQEKVSWAHIEAVRWLRLSFNPYPI